MRYTALIKLKDDWRCALDEKKEMGVIAIDLSKAFDCICHNLLLAKVKAYGVQEPALQLLRSYLHGRKQRVICNDKCSSWFASNYLQVNEDKTQAMILGNSSYRYDLEFAGTPIDINNHLKILRICLDNNLSFKEHISIMLKKVYSKIGALRRLKRLIPANTMLLLYKSFVLSHFECCNSLLMGIGKTLNKKLEDANYYGLRTIMNMRKSTDYESILRMADMNTLEHRRIEQS